MRWVILAILMFLCSIPAAAQAEKRHRDAPCTAATARPISIADAARGGRRQEWTCVRITGIVDFWTLYGSLGDIYRSTKTWENHDLGLKRRSRIGLGVFPAADDGTEFGWPWSARAPRRITVFGRLHECGRDPETGKPYDGFFMELNWCHHNRGTILVPDMILADEPVDLMRMTGSRAWRQYGDIVPIEKGSPLEANALEYVNRMFLAAHKGDRRAMLDLNDLEGVKLSSNGLELSEDLEEKPWLSKAQDILDLWFGSSDLVISRVARSAAPPSAVRIFESRWKGENHEGPWACWASESLAEKDWPISSVDTGNVAGRRYACVELTTELYEPDEILTGASRRGWKLEEPVK